MSAKQVGFRSGAQKRSLGLSIHLGGFRRKIKAPGDSSPTGILQGTTCLSPLLPTATHVSWVWVVHTCLDTHTNTHTQLCPCFGV